MERAVRIFASSNTRSNVRSPILTALMGKQRPFQKKYFSFSLGNSFRALTVLGGNGIQTGVPVFWVSRNSLSPEGREHSSTTASEIRSPEYGVPTSVWLPDLARQLQDHMATPWVGAGLAGLVNRPRQVAVDHMLDASQTRTRRLAVDRQALIQKVRALDAFKNTASAA